MRLTLKQARLLAGFTQKEIAEMLGVHVHTYMKWERNPEEMSVGTAKHFSKIVDANFENLFFDHESNLIRQESDYKGVDRFDRTSG
ncbi:helix-turn-helix transcriptional regulator [Sediminibacillus halophilus]|uniref:DNA-binding transcriptional regulator, XRE-family HTH domain n=1 Tax=Sediminibacillus halophilus TaxID=482461 RepID=A0A1G9QZK7_9BACI|nr:helix-turn-helix transcriptional regulator [Sediminibacillus halophilus]SDM15665.1 DNA-binding transcriptional regulator, XRE-family HTH domain [Sediminibacillus halophilus]